MPLIKSDLLLLTWRVTRRFSACSLVPYRPLHYRLGLSDYALAQPSHRAIPSGSPDLLTSGSPWLEPLANTTTTDRCAQ
ncbi:unnamed protein product [Staurois parvus]|uniref:Uncharacterized protein n=1 Tax=Staurois parvus TaxID=386267 RepID=A0ABN9EJL0_9NEOB|nr:unnamed protein product [Staurois parvus]